MSEKTCQSIGWGLYSLVNCVIVESCRQGMKGAANVKRMDMEHFALPLLKWYDVNKREMIWRDHLDPYYIWLSEIMLQQTRIEAAKEYFVRFTGELPDIESLANVSDERLMKLWEGLGYYNRARNLKKAAQIVVEKHGGKLPADLEELRALPGIGSYTAGAVASMAFGIRAAAVDGNVLRVVMRYEACGDDISKMSVRKRVEQEILAVMPERPGDFNQAVMELGEVICIPNGAPLCVRCPLKKSCAARAGACQEEYPKKGEKKPRRIEERTVLIYEREGKIGIRRRPAKGLLAGLYEFPALMGRRSEQELRKELAGVSATEDASGASGEKGCSVRDIISLGEAKHIFSHVEWHMQGFHIVLGDEKECLSGQQLPEGLVFVSREELDERYSLPVAFHYFWKKLNQLE